MPVTLKDIAARLNLSVTTVSRALGGYSDVAAQTRQRVLQAAEEMGYHPDVTAQRLQKRRTDTIGFVIPTFGPRFSDPYFTELLAGIGNETARQQFELLIATRSPGTPDERETYERMVQGRRVDGLLVARTRRRDERIAFLRRNGFPFVAFGRWEGELDFPYLDVDGQAGMDQATQHLIDLGHRRIAYIGAPRELMFAHFRLQGYRQAMERHGLPVEDGLIVAGDLTQKGGYEAGQRLLDLDAPPTAVLAANDLTALGVISAAQQRGLEVGSALSVVGFDNIPQVEHAHPPLTTVSQPIYDVGVTICRMLIQLLRGEELTERHVRWQPELVVRSSSGPPGPGTRAGSAAHAMAGTESGGTS